MSKPIKETFVNLTTSRKKILGEAIRRAGTCASKKVLPKVKEVLKERFAECSDKKMAYEVRCLEMDTDEKIVDAIESYVAYYEDVLIQEGYMDQPIGGMLREMIKINNKKNI